ncbi:MAG TPA: CARDB domain-containing protein [Devosiaceae bacterium]|jgi:hypothetical protein
MSRLLNSSVRAVALAAAVLAVAAGAAQAADCADPAITKFSYEKIVPTIAGELATYNFDFVATIQNVGTKDYTSTAGAQSADLTADGTAVATVDFPSLAAGATTELRGKVKGWSPLDGAQKFTATLNYKAEGGDCNADNNTMSVSAEDLEPLLRGQGG